MSKTSQILLKRTRNKHVGNPGPGLGQAQKYCGVKFINGIPTLPLNTLIVQQM
jgi:hypothetical protein